MFVDAVVGNGAAVAEKFEDHAVFPTDRDVAHQAGMPMVSPTTTRTSSATEVGKDRRYFDWLANAFPKIP